MTASSAPTRTEFGQLLKEMRHAKGLSQLALTRAAGMGRGYVAMVESGERGKRPVRESVLALAEGLGASIEERNALLKASGHGIAALPPALADITFDDFVGTLPDLTAAQRQLLVTMYDQLRSQNAGEVPARRR